MATLSVGGQLVATNDTLSNGVQDNITRLGTVASGAIGSAVTGTIGTGVTFPAGHIIKATSNMYNSANSDSFGASYATVTASGSNHWQNSITDVAASSWVWIVTTFTLRCESSATNSGAGVKLERNLDTDLFPVIEYDLYHWGFPASSNGISTPITMSWMDKTPDTGTNTYYLKGRRYTSAHTCYIYSASGGRPFSMQCFEIAQ